MSETVHFKSEKKLAHYLLDEVLPYCSNNYERMIAAIWAAKTARRLWLKHAR